MQNYKRHLLIGAVCIMASCFIRNAYAAQQFTDVPSSHWATGYITAAANNNYVSGVGNNKFNPNAPVSHVEFHAMLTKAFAPNEVHKFKTPGQNQKWYLPFMNASDVMDYTDNTMMADSNNWHTTGTQPMSRYEMALTAYNVLKANDVLGDTNIDHVGDNINDWHRVTNIGNGRYKNAVAYCYELGILSGTDNNEFEGGRNMTRAQACAVLIRMDEFINNKEYDLSKPQSQTIVPDPVVPQTNPEPVSPAEKPNTNTPAKTEAEVLAKIEELRRRFPDGYHWEESEIYNSNHHVESTFYESDSIGSYYSNRGTYAIDCAAWANYAFDYIFGDAPARVHSNWNEIKVGDLVCKGDPNISTHWMLVTEPKGYDPEFDSEYFDGTDSGPSHIIDWPEGQGSRILQMQSDPNHPRYDANMSEKITVYTRY